MLTEVVQSMTKLKVNTSKQLQYIYRICSRIVRTLIFKGGFWIYFCSAYFTHHRIVHLPVIYVLIDYRLLNRQWYIQCIYYDYNKFNY